MIEKIADTLKKKYFDRLLYGRLKVAYTWVKQIIKPVYLLYFKLKIKKTQANYRKVIEVVRKKQRIKVVFFLLNADTWKLDELYNEFQNSSRFDPLIIICPLTGKGRIFLRKQMEIAIELCRIRNYKFELGYDLTSEQAIDLKKLINPDIVFFTNPNPITDIRYRIDHYTDTLSCYIPYSFRIDNLYSYDFNAPTLNLTWINFYETDFHKDMARKYAYVKDSNVEVVGYPQMDRFRKKEFLDPWKDQFKSKKRIIWGPHWTIPGLQSTTLDWSCFLEYAIDILEIADELFDEVQFALKPHPFLFPLLEQDTVWGKEKTRKYIEQWNRRLNCQIFEGDYVDLFLCSDALIHDSGSFLVEYLSLNKPAAYVLSKENLDIRFNDIGSKAVNAHEIIRSKEGLKTFISSVIRNRDINRGKREEFINKNLITSSKSSSIVVEKLNQKLS